MRRSCSALSVTLGLALAAGCSFSPVPLEGRVCSTLSDCVDGYFCSEEGLCVPTGADAGLEAGIDASALDSGQDDAAIDDAAIDDAAIDGAAADDAAADDAAADDAGTADAGLDGAGSDAGG